ncbi:HTTM domain-containing protein [uncultured Eudoraea sp.]|uniref:HTTM domain-containing protein n=1 Tax=uncultured Eudoraea sp. TaxID=1035614 RepID=UPI0026358090|nr:HTTM domain-containing protein [uncultured Eudoraea sp.]
MLNPFLFKRIDNSQLILFRIFFGILISLESYGAILTGWVRRTMIEPSFTFTFIGFEWLQPLPGPGMYIYFFIMGTLGIFITLGYKYSLSIISFTILWTSVYLMQKTSYNNHYYLLVLISLIMCFLPANRSYSLDARANPKLKSEGMYNYVRWIVIFQLFIVYTYAALAKLYADWLDFSFVEILMKNKAHYWLIGDLLQESWMHKFISVMGILFDLLIIPALLWKPSRKIAFAAAIFFHLFNSIVFQIGIFPYLALAFTVFFFKPETIRRIFFKNKPIPESSEIIIPDNRNLILAGFGIYFAIQLILPIRHHFFKDDVLWTEEGHRLSWRMMLRTRSGVISFKVVNNDTGQIINVNLNEYLTKKQKGRVAAYPDFIWQFAQRLKKIYSEDGSSISVYVNSRVRINNDKLRPFIDPEVDLAAERWYHLRHHNWILPSEETKTKLQAN